MSPIPSLANLAPDALLTEGEAADYLRIRPGALKTMRLRGRGPAAVHVGRAVRYGVAALRAFIACQSTGRPSQAPSFGAPFEPHLTGLACPDRHPLALIEFAAACPLAAAIDALLWETNVDWLRATLPDLHAMLMVWGSSAPCGWPQNAEDLAKALVEPTGQLAADLIRLGIVAECRATDRGPGVDLIRFARPSRADRFPSEASR